MLAIALLLAQQLAFAKPNSSYGGDRSTISTTISFWQKLIVANSAYFKLILRLSDLILAISFSY